MTGSSKVRYWFISADLAPREVEVGRAELLDDDRLGLVLGLDRGVDPAIPLAVERPVADLPEVGLRVGRLARGGPRRPAWICDRRGGHLPARLGPARERGRPAAAMPPQPCRPSGMPPTIRPRACEVRARRRVAPRPPAWPPGTAAFAALWAVPDAAVDLAQMPSGSRRSSPRSRRRRGAAPARRRGTTCTGVRMPYFVLSATSSSVSSLFCPCRSIWSMMKPTRRIAQSLSTKSY